MPCVSTVTRTKMTDEGRLVAALEALGYVVTQNGSDYISGGLGSSADLLRFSRRKAGEAFETSSTYRDALNAVQRKYSEIGVREWAKRKGFSIAAAENDGRKLTLINRRG